MIETLNKENIDLLNSELLTKNKVLHELEVNPYANYLIYLENKETVAYIYYSDIYDRTEINMLEVKKEKRNQKIGTKLLKKYLEITNKDSTLEVSVENEKAIALYKKFDYKQIAIRKKYYNGIDGILMERKQKRMDSDNYE